MGMPIGSGDIEALAQTMTSAQRLRFKQAVVAQAIHFVSKLLPPEAKDEGHRRGIRAAVVAPTLDIMKPYDSISRTFQHGRIFSRP